MKVIHKGATGQSTPRDFFCAGCKAWFEAWTKWSEADDAWEQRTHSCGALCSTGIPPGSKIAIRGGEWNSVPRDHRKEWQRYWNLTDNEAAQVTREDMDRVMREKGISFVDASWDRNVNGGKRERGEAIELPPDTEDAREVDEWNANKYGEDYVREKKQETRAVFESACAGTVERLPEADDGDVHSTPHVIDVEKTKAQLAAEPVVTPERKRELQGRVVSG